ncbi:MAG: hypothetical protein LUH14_12650 [Clostridiaceae bacterium]|nr:hypothetical protein [Clostridiaceae bacterium]
MDKTKKRTVIAFAAIIVLAVLVLAGYILINRQAEQKAQEEVLPDTEIGKLLAKDLDSKYPGTPTEVVKLYWRMNCCIYNEDLSDEDFDALLTQMRKLYDDELLAETKNSFDTMSENLKKDKEEREDQTFSAYVVQKNSTVEVETLDDRECATVISSILLKAKNETTKVYEKFTCRKDSDGKWKILGWQESDEEEAETVGVE